MNQAIEHILLQDHLSSGDVQRIQRACTEDPALARAVRNWAQLTRHIGAAFKSSLPEAEALVLYTLSGQDASLLDTDDRRRLDEVKTEVETAIEAHPSVQTILARVRSDVQDFSSVWDEAMQPGSATRPDLPAVRNPFRKMTIFPLPRGWSYGLAAALVVLVTSVIFLQQDRAELERVVVSAPEGKTNVVRLPDESTVRLTSGSSIEFAPGETFDRQLTLKGNAFFDVTPGDDLFTVVTNNALTRVFGTSFGVSTSLENSLTEVVLVSGKISLSSSASPLDDVALSPGQSSRVVGTDRPTPPAAVDVSQALAWSDLFIFKDTPLANVSEQLAESFEIPILVDEDLLARTVTGTFAPENGLTFILEAISAALNLNVEGSEEIGSFRITN